MTSASATPFPRTFVWERFWRRGKWTFAAWWPAPMQQGLSASRPGTSCWLWGPRRSSSSWSWRDCLGCWPGQRCRPWGCPDWICPDWRRSCFWSGRRRLAMFRGKCRSTSPGSRTCRVPGFQMCLAAKQNYNNLSFILHDNKKLLLSNCLFSFLSLTIILK